MLEPEIVEVVEGRAEVRQIFRVGKSTVIAGCYVTDGRIVRNGGARVWRGGKVIATDRIESLRRFRDDVREVAQNFECGIGLAGYNDLVEGDIIECFTNQTRSRIAELRHSRRMSQRTERVDELLRQEIGALLAKEIADPRIGFATITDVETSPDLRHAKVWVSVIGGKADRDETLRALQQAMGFVRHELGRRLRIRRIPELHVRLDDSAERGTRVLHLLNELEAGRRPAGDRAVHGVAADARPAAAPRGRHRRSGRAAGGAGRAEAAAQRRARRRPRGNRPSTGRRTRPGAGAGSGRPAGKHAASRIRQARPRRG